MRSFGLLSAEEIENSPSFRDGLDAETIFKYSRASCTYIQKVAEKLRMRLITISTAKVFFWRYFARQSFKTHDRYLKHIEDLMSSLILAVVVEQMLTSIDGLLLSLASFLLPKLRKT